MEAGTAKYPQAKLVQWEPVNQRQLPRRLEGCLRQYMDAQYKLEEADVILSLDADFLSAASRIRASCRMAAAYAERHRYEEDKTHEPDVRRRDACRR